MSLLFESVKDNRFYKTVTKDNLFFANQVLGENTIRNRFRSAFEQMGIERFDTIKPHALRGYSLPDWQMIKVSVWQNKWPPLATTVSQLVCPIKVVT